MVPPDHWVQNVASKCFELPVLHLEGRSHLRQSRITPFRRQQGQVPAKLGQPESFVHLLQRAICLIQQRFSLGRHGLCNRSHRTSVLIRPNGLLPSHERRTPHYPFPLLSARRSQAAAACERNIDPECLPIPCTLRSRTPMPLQRLRARWIVRAHDRPTDRSNS